MAAVFPPNRHDCSKYPRSRDALALLSALAPEFYEQLLIPWGWSQGYLMIICEGYNTLPPNDICADLVGKSRILETTIQYHQTCPLVHTHSIPECMVEG